jgi:Ohr subfamily peroxiredoxin
MSKVLYTAQAHVVGGREAGHGRTSDGRLEVDLRLPSEMGGTEDAGTNPEQLFAVGYAACFEGALGAVARRRKVDLGDVAIDSEVGLMTNEDRGFGIQVALDVTLGGIADQAEAAEIVRDAHQVCPYSNATRGNVDVTLTANGGPVE